MCLSTLVLDGTNCSGAVTVTRDPTAFGADPFARLFPGTVLPTDLFSPVPPPCGPGIERYAGVAWPAGDW